MLYEFRMAGGVVGALGNSRVVDHIEGVAKETTGAGKVAGEAWGIWVACLQ